MFFIKHRRIACLWLVIGWSLPPSHVQAQSFPRGVQAQNTLQQRVERSIGRQRVAVAAMGQSIAAQQLSVIRQRRPLHSPPPTPGQRLPEEIAFTCDSLPQPEIKSLVARVAARTSVSAELIHSVMRQESAFKPCAISARGAMGLMQLMPGTAEELGVNNAFDPEQNVLAGATLLSQLMNHYGGDLNMTLSAYNAGARRVDTTGVAMIPETVNYVARVLSWLSPPAESDSTRARSVRETAPRTKARITGGEGGK